MAKAMDGEAVRKALEALPGWQLRDDAIVKKFEFGSFREAMGFLVRVAFEAEQRNHHPEIHNVYNRVTLSLSTHDAGGKVTEKDIDLAKAIEQMD